ncbi:MAG: hypothetical protein PHR35_06355 [Kiritimatiellae bacterium]|nr:hypothetical protein [Kiritimatiellia bacterium]
MTKTKECQKCGGEYSIGRLSFDPGVCGQCKPGFFGPPLWLQPIPAGTKDLWRTVIVIHVILFFLFGLLLDGGVISFPGSLYCLTVVIYLLVRFVVARFRGYPILSRAQAVGLLLLPAYAPAFMIALFHWVQRLRWGT